MTRRISLIAALDRNGVIGDAGRIPWRLPADLKNFKRVTMGKPLVMGRKTYESIGRPLPGRQNIVLTRQRHFEAPGCTVVHSLDEALAAAGEVAEVMVAGGGNVYRQFLPHADRLYLTFVETTAEGETTFPPFDPKAWRLIFEEAHPADDDNPFPYRFTIFERKNGGGDLPRRGETTTGMKAHEGPA